MEQPPIHSTFASNPSCAVDLSLAPTYAYVAAEGNWHFCHHPEICVFKNRLYAMWSNSPSGEDEVGQRILFASSGDDGETWSDCNVLAHGVPDERSVLTAAGWLSRENSLLAYFGSYAYAQDGPSVDGRGAERFGAGMVRTTLYCAETTDGERFSSPKPLQVPLCPNIGPQKTKSGRLIITGNWAHACSDDPMGDGTWHLAGFAEGKTDETSDDPEAFWRVSRALGLPGICEGSFYQTDDGVLHMLHRSYGPWLYESQSQSDGESWSMPVQTGFSDSNTKFHFGRLPDGRFYYLGSPVPNSGRNPLVLSLSEDGICFDRHFIVADKRVALKYPGYAKGGMYGYPHSVLHEGHLYVVCSIWKEDIVVFKIDISIL